MGQISIPAANKSGYSMFWNSMWDSKHNYNVFLKQDIFIKSSLILFLNDYSSDKLFFFLNSLSKNNFNKYSVNVIKQNKNNNYSFFYNYIRKTNNNDLFFSKLWLIRYQSWIVLNLSIFTFLKNEILKKKLEINFDNWFYSYYKNLFFLKNNFIKNKYIF